MPLKEEEEFKRFTGRYIRKIIYLLLSISIAKSINKFWKKTFKNTSELVLAVDGVKFLSV